MHNTVSHSFNIRLVSNNNRGNHNKKSCNFVSVLYSYIIFCYDAKSDKRSRFLELIPAFISQCLDFRNCHVYEIICCQSINSSYLLTRKSRKCKTGDFCISMTDKKALFEEKIFTQPT